MLLDYLLPPEEQQKQAEQSRHPEQQKPAAKRPESPDERLARKLALFKEIKDKEASARPK